MKSLSSWLDHISYEETKGSCTFRLNGDQVAAYDCIKGSYRDNRLLLAVAENITRGKGHVS